MTAIQKTSLHEQPGNKLRIIDISDHQAGIDLSRLDIHGVIIKATEGTSFTSGQYDIQYRQAQHVGLLRGVYHYACPSQNTAVDEASYFVSVARASIEDPSTVVVLDYEDTITDPVWACEWLTEVHRQTGKRPLIYMSESVVNAHDWLPVISLGTRLWVAKYVNDLPYYDWRPSTPPLLPDVTWGDTGYVLWQFTARGWLDGYGGDIDCDWFYGTRQDWMMLAQVHA